MIYIEKQYKKKYFYIYIYSNKKYYIFKIAIIKITIAIEYFSAERYRRQRSAFWTIFVIAKYFLL